MTAQAHGAKRHLPGQVWFFLAVLGAAVFGAVGGLRGSVSFIIGMGLAVGWLQMTVLIVRRAGRRSPTSTMTAAMMSYAVLVIFFAVLLGVLDGDTIRPGAFSGGLICSAALASIHWALRGGRSDD